MATKPLPVHGVDISHHQSGTLDLAGAKRRGLRWLYHKATEGDGFRDANYGRRRTEAAKAGVPFGAYHFARADVGDAEREAKFFLDVAAPKPGDLRPALDLETTEGLSLDQIRTWAKTFIAYVEKRTGVKPVVYTPYDLGSADDGCILWRPRYNNSNTPPSLKWDIFQFSNGVLGVPNKVEGIGNVDLNFMRADLTVADLLIPAKGKPAKPPKPPKPEPVRLDVMHASLQFSDSDKQHTQDLLALFKRAVDRKVAWLTGTEAGPGAGNTNDELIRIGKEMGYRVWVPSSKQKRPKGVKGWSTDCWIAVREDLIDGNWTVDFIPAIPGSSELYEAQGLPGRTLPRWGPKGVVTVSFDNDLLGRINLGAAHYLTQARSPRTGTVKGVDHWKMNERLAKAITDWAVTTGKGTALAFYGGDQNMADNRNSEPQGDTFFGGPMTSTWDELGKWENTGHGTIDVIASYDADGRVEALMSRALDDKEFFQHSDHFVVEAAFAVKPLRK